MHLIRTCIFTTGPCSKVEWQAEGPFIVHCNAQIGHLCNDYCTYCGNDKLIATWGAVLKKMIDKLVTRLRCSEVWMDLKKFPSGFEFFFFKSSHFKANIIQGHLKLLVWSWKKEIRTYLFFLWFDWNTDVTQPQWKIKPLELKNRKGIYESDATCSQKQDEDK